MGLPHSGTTLVEQVLASHPRVFGEGNSVWLQTFDSLSQATGHTESPLDCLQHLDRESIERIGRRHLDALAALNNQADRIVDKMPENTLFLGLIAILFPHARLIHCRRDLRDVVLIVLDDSVRQPAWACDLHHIETRIREYRRLMYHWRAVLPVATLDVDYEAMVADPRAIVAGAGGLVRPGVGPGLPGISNAATRADDQRRTGPPTYLSQLGRPVEELRAQRAAGRRVRPARDRFVIACPISSSLAPVLPSFLRSHDEPCHMSLRRLTTHTHTSMRSRTRA